MRYLKQFLCTMLVALGVAVALASPAEATHGRYGTISWKKLGPPAAANAIEITLTTGWRRNFFTPLPNLGSIINAGTLSVKTSGGSVIANFSGNDEVIFVDAANNWILCRRVVTYTIPNAALTYTLSYENCCRISTLEGGNNDLNFYLRSMVNLSLEDNSPVSAMPPIVYLQRGGVRTFYVPGIDADAGNTLRWILAPTGSAALVGSGLNQQSPTFGGQVLSIDPSTGLATWNVLGTQTVGDLWAVQFIIEERSPGNVLLNSIPVDFLIEIEEEDPNTVPPVVVPGSPVCGGTLPVIAGSNISFTIGFSDSDIGDVVTLSSGGVPPGATMTPTLPVSGNPVSSTFSWTPSLVQIGSYLVQFVGTDQGNNQTFCNYTISVTGQPPDCDAGGPYSATCICANDCATIQLDGSGSSDPDGGALTYAWSGPGIVFDNASSVTPTACFPVGTTTVTLVVTDNQSLSSTCTVDVIIDDDNTPPTISCPVGFAVECEADVPACNPADASASDNCGTVTVTCADGPLVGGGCGGTIIRTYTATDACGNSATCTQVITVDDNTPPTISCPAGFAVECEADVPVCNPADASASDNCGTVTVTCADGPLAGGGCGGTIIRTYTATDACGNSATCTQVITVDDNTPPTISCPAGFAVECEADVPACNPADASASDNCGAVTLTCADGPLVGGGCGGTIIRTYTATDACGNTAFCTQVITVDDNTPPSISCPAGFAVECLADVPVCNPADASASDNCGTVTVTCADGPLVGGGCGGTIIRTYTATDACGNSATCTQVITVDDNTPPTIVCPGDLTVECGSPTDPSATGEPAVEDNCDLAPAVSHADAITPGNCLQEFTITRTWVAIDVCNNAATCVQVITVDDSEGPEMTCPPDVTIECSASTDPANTGTASGVDACDPNPAAVTYSDVVTPGVCGGSSEITRTWTGTDACGNPSSCIQTITIVDNTPPTITACPPNITVDGLANLPACGIGEFDAEDLCGDVTLTCSRNGLGGVGCSNAPVNVVYTYTATDECGNSASCTRIVSVILPACNFFVSAASSSGQELEVVSGSQITVPLSLDTVADELSRVNLAFGYNPSALTLLKVTPGEAVGQWDEFTYEIVPGVDENYRVVSVSMSTDAQAGESVPAGLFSPHGVVANMQFLVAGDRGLEGSVQMIIPEQARCDNNCLTSRDGSRSYVRSDIASAPCAAVSGVALSSVVMTSGRVRILAPVERTGDVNLNGVANEVGDAVLFVEYLTYDDVVLSPDPAHRAMQIAATDVNGDGVTATVADLIYLIRVVTGDIPAGWIAKLSPSAGAASVDLRTDNGSVSVSVTSSAPVGGALLVFRVNGSSMGQPQLSPAASAMNMRASGSDGRVKILIYGWDAGAHLNSGTNELLSMALSGMENLELESVELSDERGALLQVSAAKSTVPTEYALGQNYPNPFNAGTVIPVQLSNAGSWNMTIHNVMGQVVRQFDGVDAAGTVLVPWDGRNDDGLAVPSGIYFYRVSLPTGQSMTRKMTLLK